MAYADYRHCEVCDCKVFYDANLDYEQGREIPKEELARQNGQEVNWGYRLMNLGDWAVLCRECAQTHKTIVVPIEP